MQTLLLTSITFAGAASAARQTTPEWLVTAALEVYQRGDHGDAATSLAKLPEILRSQTDVQNLVGGLSRLLATTEPTLGAAFGLEVAAAIGGVPGSGTRSSSTGLSPALQVLQLAWRRVDHRSVPDGWARDWYRAATALWEGVAVNRRLPRRYDGDWPRGWFGIDQLLERALRRFPEAPEFLLASGVRHEQELHWYVYTRTAVRTALKGASPTPVTDPTGAITYLVPGFDNLIESRGYSLREAQRAFTRVRERGNPNQAAVATLHLGTLLMYQGRATDAAGLWRELEATPDADVRYLAHIFLGRALWDEGQRKEALEHLAAAHELQPEAQSALAMLMTFLFLLDDREQASRIAEHILVLPIDAHDPWWSYLRGAHGEWPMRLAAVRRGLRQ